jgi:adenylate cyclase
VIAARAVDTLLADAVPVPLGRAATFAASLILLMGLGGAYLRLTPALGAALWLAASAAAWGAGAAGLAAGLVLPWLAWVLTAGLLLSAVHGYRVLIEGAARRRVAHAFRHYLSPALVDRLAEHPEQLKLGGESRTVSILFADLAGYTTFAEQRRDDPEAVVAHLNAVFAAIGDRVDASGGYVDKFMGDGVMAVWGAPDAAPEPEAAAARAALACVAAVAALDGAPRLRVGLSCGPAIAGNLGSRQRFDYTVVGEAVNRAARLEELNKAHGTQVLMDAAFAAQLPPGFRTRALGPTVLRGMTRQIEVFELLGYDPA